MLDRIFISLFLLLLDYAAQLLIQKQAPYSVKQHSAG